MLPVLLISQETRKLPPDNSFESTRDLSVSLYLTQTIITQWNSTIPNYCTINYYFSLF